MKDNTPNLQPDPMSADMPSLELDPQIQELDPPAPLSELSFPTEAEPELPEQTPAFDPEPDALPSDFQAQPEDAFSPEILPEPEDSAETQIWYPPEDDFSAEPPRDFSEFDLPVEEAPLPCPPAETGDDPDPFADTEPSPFYPEESLTEPASEEVPQEVPQLETPPRPANTRPVRKSRPRRKKGDGLFGLPHLAATVIWLAIIVAIGISLGRMLWLCASDVLAFGRDSKDVSVTIQTTDTIDDIADKLYEKGLIRYPGLFKLYASIAVDDGEIAPGTYTLNTILDYHALVGSMSSSSSNRAVVEDVLIPEGYNCRQIFELLEQNGICSVAELEAYAADGEFQDFWFLEGIERGDKYCLEGFLFPDTYDFYAGSTPREAIGKMLLGFQARIDQEEITAKLVTLNERLSEMMRKNGCSEDYIAENQMSLYQLLTVASLIEKETAGSSESPVIASVIFNRLTQDEVYERYLGIDAAIIYVTGSAENIDTGIDSPYNTYTHAGLTPTPIANPGLSSINAALNFEDTDYYYYVLNPETQLHQFSKTYEEHQQWIETFRGESE